MRLLPSQTEEVLGVAARWKRQYYNGVRWGRTITHDSEAVYNALAALTADSTPADVAAIIGNTSWIGSTCTECGNSNAVVLVGEEPEYESATVWLCLACVKKLVALVEGSR